MEGFSSNELNTRRLRTRAIPVSPKVIPHSSSTVLLERVERLDRLADDEESGLEFINLTTNWAHMKKHVSCELDTDQGEGIT